MLKGLDIFRATIRVSAVIDGVHAKEDIRCPHHLCPCEGVGEKDGIAPRDVGDRDPFLYLLIGSTLWHVKIIGECRATYPCQVNIHHQMFLGTQCLGHPLGGLQLQGVALSIAETQAVDLIAF